MDLWKTAPVPRRANLEVPFLLAYGAMLAGVAMSLVDATATTTNVGGSDGGIYTSIYLAVLLTTTALSVPYGPSIAARFGSHRTMVATVVISALLWLATGACVIADFDPMQVLVIGAVGIGLLSGVFSALIPLFAKAYMGDGQMTMAEAYSRLSIPRGIAWAAGAAVGGMILHRVDPGWGLIARAALGIPIALLLTLRPPAVEPAAPAVANGAWADMRSRLKESVALRRAILLGCGLAVTAVPMVSMIVPIADALEHKPLIPGAGTLMVTIAVGQMFAPAVVSVLERSRTNLRAAAVAGLASAVVIAAYGLSALVMRGLPELVVWGVIGFVFGALTFGGNSLNLGAATDAADEEHAGAMVATFVFTTSLAAPLGVLIWGYLMSRVSVETAVLAGAAGTAVVSALFLRRPTAERGQAAARRLDPRSE